MSRTRPARPAARRALAGVALAALAVPLAACSGGGDVQAFCEGGEEATAEMDAAGSLANDPEAFADTVSQVRDSFDELEAPDDIAADWEVFTSTFGDLDDSLSEIDPTDQEAFVGALTEFSENAQSEDLAEASDNLSTYFAENCEA
jgi:hypothetical protein